MLEIIVHLRRLASLFRFVMLFAISALVAGGMMLRPAAAAERLERWELEVLINLQGLQTDRQCVPNGDAQSIHILGVSADDTLLDEVARTAILTDLSQLIAVRTNARTTKADNFQSIATSYSGVQDQNTRELGRLIEAASNADITVLVRPYRDRGASVDAEIRLWARGAGTANSGLNCVQSFNVEIPTKEIDPACAPAFAKAKQDGDPARLEAFRDFFPQCPEAAEADRLVTELKAEEAQRAERERCERNFARARAEGTVSAYSIFLDENIDCPGRDVVMALRDQARKSEECETAYRDARRLDTIDGYEKFLLDNRACPQADTASAFLTMKRQEEQRAQEPDPAPSQQAARSQQPQYQPPAGNQSSYNTASYRGYPIPADLARSQCGQLWYMRNLIYHLNGYCFKTAKAQRYFSNASCYGGTPSGSDAREVSRIQALERQNGC
ncbi:YARHG domain-containing protein [Jiella marina]|uniref:YARHG domain-containing protein n=1 Tax=Jiella sp. LLJ827 TaxID=2917712 RepID=UPI00210078EE|nr:YARHG domain-containing protein [Jiella sp. LLJ827]MCQ0986778.1 YARHG domain-containing protein [Jiella sp. LLJ827]